MDFKLTNEQMIEYVARCIDDLNQESGEKKFKFEVLDIDYPDITIKFILNKTDLSATYNLTFSKNYVFCRYGCISNDMQTIYIKYMYELFGEDYLKELEADMRVQIDERKKEAHDEHRQRVSALDNQLINYLILLNRIRKNNNNLNQ